MSDDDNTTNYFVDLNTIDCSKHVQKKGKFGYLSWPWAVRTLREHHPDATWEVVKHPPERVSIDENIAWLPYLKTELGYFVETSVTVMGMTLNHIHPILNHQNKPIEKPNSFDVNTSIMRCLVKNIALHGIGLYIYAGEDLPPDGDEPPTGYTPEQFEQFHKILSEGDAMEYVGFMAELNPEVQSALYNSFEQGKKVEGKKAADVLNNSGHDLVTQYVDTLQEAARADDSAQILETIGELQGAGKALVWKRLDPETQKIIREAVREAE